MSTKTTYKRIALVAVAALGFGLLSVAPSSAISQSDTLAISATGNATTVSFGSTASTTLTQTFLGAPQDTMTATVSLVSGPTGNTLMPTLTRIAGSDTGGSTSLTAGLIGNLVDTATVQGTFTLATGKWTLALPGTETMLPGTYVIKITPANLAQGLVLGLTPIAAAVTWTVTVGAPATAVPADSFSFAVLDATSTVGTGSTSAVVVVPISTGSAVAAIRVYPRTGDAATLATGSTTLVATMTGPGTIRTVLSTSPDATGASTGARSITTTNTGTQSFVVYVHGDGTSGTTVVTLTMGTIVLTKTVKFYGAAASVTATLVTPVINTGSSNAGVVTAVVADANGNPVPGASLWLVSGTPTVFASATSAVVTSGSTGKASFSITGLTAGTSTVTLQSYAVGSAAGTTGFSSTAVSVRVGDDVTASVVMSLDKATYAQGEAAVLTVTQKDAAGNLIANGTNSPFSSAISSRVISGNLPGDSLVTTGSNLGVLTYKINVPTTSGAFTISATAGSGFTGTFAATATVSPSAAETANAAAVTANADAIAAAADAAAEATDAANAATDAANAAAEAADAATAAAQDAADAIAALSTQVADLVAGLTAQISAQKAAITALTNLVIKIQKKVKA